MKNLVRLLLCLLLAGFTIARATNPGSALIATSRTMQKKAEAAMVKVARTEKDHDPKEPKKETFDVSESEKYEVAGEEDTVEVVESDEDDRMEDASDDEGEDLNDDDGGDDDAGDDGGDDGGD
jgi:hypothetical protein